MIPASVALRPGLKVRIACTRSSGSWSGVVARLDEYVGGGWRVTLLEMPRLIATHKVGDCERWPASYIRLDCELLRPSLFRRDHATPT